MNEERELMNMSDIEGTRVSQHTAVFTAHHEH